MEFPAPGRWDPPEPSALPAKREALIDSLRNPFQTSALVYNLATERGAMPALSSDLGAEAARLLEQERARLAAAELYFVTADMTRLALAAAETLPVHTLHPEDVPAASGFVVFAEPIGAYRPDPLPRGPGVRPADTGDDVVMIVAASWGPLDGVLAGQAGVWITFWSPSDPAIEIPRIMQRYGVKREKAEATYRQALLEFTWDNEMVTKFGADGIVIKETTTDGPVLHSEDFATTDVGWEQIKNTTVAWGQAVRATWLLITQPGVTDVDEQPLPDLLIELETSRVALPANDRGRSSATVCGPGPRCTSGLRPSRWAAVPRSRVRRGGAW
ncbi:hypothetical protein AB0F91_39660 [Amycolatopsis sp. NPDC023774]|uniref:hypothetical protein n=1 Tax=Amycolatopsis sp. NPDC023774 TaxID=3155015 RepID=UPI0033FEB30C